MPTNEELRNVDVDSELKLAQTRLANAQAHAQEIENAKSEK